LSRAFRFPIFSSLVDDVWIPAQGLTGIAGGTAQSYW